MREAGNTEKPRNAVKGERTIRQEFSNLKIGQKVELKIDIAHATVVYQAKVAFFTKKLIGFQMPYGIETFQKKQLYHNVGVRMTIKN